MAPYCSHKAPVTRWGCLSRPPGLTRLCPVSGGSVRARHTAPYSLSGASCQRRLSPVLLTHWPQVAGPKDCPPGFHESQCGSQSSGGRCLTGTSSLKETTKDPGRRPQEETPGLGGSRAQKLLSLWSWGTSPARVDANPVLWGLMEAPQVDVTKCHPHSRPHSLSQSFQSWPVFLVTRPHAGHPESSHENK